MRVVKVLGFILVVVPILMVALIVGTVAVLKNTDFNNYKPLIVEEVRKVTGRDLAITGDLSLDISFTPGIVVDGVMLSNADWGSRPDMVSVRRLEAQIALTSFIFGVLEVKRIVLTGADILLETDRQGHANFAFEPLGAEAEAGQQPEEAGVGIGTIPLVREAEIRDSRLTYVSAATGATYSAVVDSLKLRSEGPDEPISLVYAGSYNDAPVRANASLGTLAGLLEPGKPWPVDLKLDAGGAVVTLIGAIADPLIAGGFDLAIKAQGDQFGDVSQLVGAEFPSLGAYSISGQVIGGATTAIKLAGLNAQLGKSIISGEVSVTLTGEQPTIRANLASDKIDLAALGADVNATLHDANTALSLKDGKLEIASFKATLVGAAITVNGTMAKPFAGVGLDLAVSLKGDQAGDLSELTGAKIPALGAYSLAAHVTGDAVSAIKLAGLKAQIGTADIAGEVTVISGGERRVIDAKLTSREINLAALGAGVNAKLQDSVAALSVRNGKLDIRSLKTTLAGAIVTVNGTIADTATLKGLDLAIAARGDRFADLSEQIGGKVLALGGYSFAGRVTGDLASTINISGLAAHIGDSDVSGDAKITLSGKHPAVDTKLASDKIDLAALGAGNAPLRGTIAILSLKDEKLFIESFEGNLAGATIIVEGMIAEPAKARGLDLSVAVKGEQFGDLSELVGGKMPALGSYAISTRVNGDAAATIRSSALAARVGESDLSGDATVTLAGERPFIDASLSSNRIDIAILGGAAGDADGVRQQEAAKKQDRIFPDDPLPLEGLKAINADLRLNVAAVTGQGPLLRNAVVILSLRGGLLDIESFKADLYDGVFESAASIDSRYGMAGLIARVALREVDLRPMLEKTARASAAEGRVNFDLDVTGQGNSIRDIMAGLNGKVTFAMGKGRIRSRVLQTWIGGPTQILGNVLALNVGDYSVVNCALGLFDINKGLATSNGLLLDTAVAAFVSKGTVNLATEALDMIINPKVKKTTLSAVVPVHIRGTLANPEYSPDKTAVARRVGGLLGAFVFPPALILGLGELGTFKGGDCAGLAESAGGKTNPEQTQPMTEQQPPNLPGKILKGTGETITKGLLGQ